MAIRTYKVTLDSKNTIAPEPVFLRQGDKTGAVVIDATLMDNGSPVSLDGLTPMFKANTADGQAVIADSTGFNIVNASGGEFTYQVPNALSAVPGKIMTAYFSFSDTSGTESTFDVAFIIKKAVDITKPQADEYITIIDGTIQSLQQKIDAMNIDIQTILNAYKQGDFYNKSETDSKDAATLASAKTYADTGDAATLASAKTYADTGDAATLASAKTYADKDNYYTKADIENNMVHRLVVNGVNGAASPAHLTVNKIARLCTLEIDSRLPTGSGTMYWIAKEYATGIGNVFIRTGNATLTVNGNGNVELLSNSDDSAQSIGSVTWGY